MDTEPLVSQLEFDEGQKAVAAIKAAGVPVRLAFWAYFGDATEWRLVIVTSSLVQVGPRSVYTTIQKAFSKADVSIPLRLVTLAAPHEPIARLGINSGRLVAPFGGGHASIASGGTNVMVDPRYVYRDD